MYFCSYYLKLFDFTFILKKANLLHKVFLSEYKIQHLAFKLNLAKFMLVRFVNVYLPTILTGQFH